MNQLSKTAGVELSPITGGALVSAERQTSVPGIFACGNVLHVHDLVDFVSEEAEIAGKAAVRYLKEKTQKDVSVKLLPTSGVRYIFS